MQRAQHQVLARRAAVTAGALALAATATLTVAPPATAVGARGCNSDHAAGTWKIADNHVHLRSGPGKRYRSKGLLSKGTRIKMRCTWSSKNALWRYGKVRTGPHAGTWGWTWWQHAHA